MVLQLCEFFVLFLFWLTLRGLREVGSRQPTSGFGTTVATSKGPARGHCSHCLLDCLGSQWQVLLEESCPLGWGSGLHLGIRRLSASVLTHLWGEDLSSLHFEWKIWVSVSYCHSGQCSVMGRNSSKGLFYDQPSLSPLAGFCVQRIWSLILSTSSSMHPHYRGQLKTLGATLGIFWVSEISLFDAQLEKEKKTKHLEQEYISAGIWRSLRN